jgi:hypothetical protein
MGLPRPYPGSRVHPPDCFRPLLGGLPNQLALQCLSGHPRPRLRPPLRTCLPPRTGGQGTGRNLPPEARLRRPQGRHYRAPAARTDEEKRQTHRLRWRRSRFVDRGARPGRARLPGHCVRRRRGPGRHDAQPDSEVPPARQRDRRRMRLHHRPGGRNALQPVGRQPQGTAGRRLGRGLRRHRRAKGARCADPGPPGSRQAHSYRHRLAGQCGFRPYDEDCEARHCPRRRQYGDGLLPFGAPDGW